MEIMYRYMATSAKYPGFTLIEFLIYIGITSIIVTAMVVFMWNVINLTAKVSVNGELASEERYLDERLSSEIKNALDINTSTSNFGVDLATVAGSKISLKASAPNDPTLIDVTTGTLRITEGTSTPVALTGAMSKVVSLIFTNYSAASGTTKHVGYTLTLSTVSSSRQEFQKILTSRSSAEIRSN